MGHIVAYDNPNHRFPALIYSQPSTECHPSDIPTQLNQYSCGWSWSVRMWVSSNTEHPQHKLKVTFAGGAVPRFTVVTGRKILGISAYATRAQYSRVTSLGYSVLKKCSALILAGATLPGQESSKQLTRTHTCCTCHSAFEERLDRTAAADGLNYLYTRPKFGLT